MKKSIVVILILGALVNSCKKSNDNTYPVADTVNGSNIGPDTVTYKKDFENFKANTQRTMQELTDSVSAYTAKMKTATGKQKAQWDKMRADIDKRYSDLQQRLSSYTDKGKIEFEEFRANFNSSLDTLKMKMKQLY
jgi:hypothetical protein